MLSAQTQFATSHSAAQLGAVGISRLAYGIGGITFGLSAANGMRMKLDDSLREFAVTRAECDVEIQVSLVPELRVPQQKPLFRSGGLWTLFAEDEGFRLNFLRPHRMETPYKSAWFDGEFRNGEVALSEKFFSAADAMYPMEYPLDEVLMIHHLASGKGLEVHALGLVDEAGRGHLFLGHSGAGKSTSARLWQKQKGVRILSDDRIILRRDDSEKGGQLWMHGTPWHGDAGIASPESALLTHVYVLEQGPRNELLAMPRSLATAEIFARSFVPRHCEEALNFVLQFIDEVCREVPCDRFRFVPNESAVETIRNARD
jgi:adenylate kinase family enzyme